MSDRVSQILYEIEQLSDKETQELLGQLVDYLEVHGWLHLANLDDWDNQEDVVYDNL